MQYTSDSESPDDFHFWTGVSTIAGALRRRAWINMRKFLWTPNFYIILIGPPGIVSKSTTINAGFNLLHKVEGIRFGPESSTWQALGDALAQAQEYAKYTNSLGEEALVGMSCLTISVSELGTFLMPDDPKFLPFLIEMWDGKTRPFQHKTKSSGNIEIQNPWLNIIACTTPAGLRACLPSDSISGGFASRVIFVYGDKKRQYVAYPDERIPEKEYFEMERMLVEDLAQMALLVGEYKLLPEARRWGHDWYYSHWSGERPAHMASDRFEGYLARKQTHIHKLAIVLAAARNNVLEIEKHHLEEANQILTSVENHMLKAFESVGVVDEAKRVAEIVAFVRNYKVLTGDELFRLVMNTMGQKEFEEALRAAVRGGLLELTMKNGRRAVKPSGSYERRSPHRGTDAGGSSASARQLSAEELQSLQPLPPSDGSPESGATSLH